MMDWDKITIDLNNKLNPAHVKKPSGSFGPKGDYIEGWHAIAEANRIFGFGGWSYNIKRLSQDSLIQAQKNGKDQWQAAYTCIVTLTVGDATREDVGFGSGFAGQIGDAIEGATKEAVTDALKRTLRTFGNPFGLALYDKSKANVGVPDATEAEKQAKRKVAATSIADQIRDAPDEIALAKLMAGKMKTIVALHAGDFPAFQIIKDAADLRGVEIRIPQKDPKL